MDFLRTTAELLFAIRLRKARALFFHLLADPLQMHRTEKFLDLLWPDTAGDKAALSLRQVVRQLRVALAATPDLTLETGGGTVALRLPAEVAAQMPLERMVAARLSAQAWDPEAAAALRAILSAAEGLDGMSPSFDSWLAITRAALHSAMRRALDARLAGRTEDAASHQAAEFALELEPANEAAVRHLMALDWRANRPTRAIERYDALYRHLDVEFDQEPEPETVNLLAAIKLDPGGGGGHRPVARAPQVPISVALDSGAGLGRELLSLAAVLHSDLRMRMGQFREWRLVDDGASEGAQVRVLLRPAGGPEGFALHVAVMEGGGGAELWTQTIPQPSRDWEGKVRQLLNGIAAALSVVVAERTPTDAAAAVYDRWLRAQALLDDWSPATESEAIAMLEQITREAPRFGPAHAELAGALNVRHVLRPGLYLPEEVRQTALNHALEAVSIDPLDTRAHRVLAWCYCYRGEFELAEFHFDQALALNPANALTRTSATLGLAFANRLDKAAALARSVRAEGAVLQPGQRVYLAAVACLCGDPAEAVALYEQGPGEMTTAGGWQCLALWQLGRHDEARACLDSWLAQTREVWSEPGTPDTAAVLDWFAAIFPLREARVRADLRATLEAIAAMPEALPRVEAARG